MPRPFPKFPVERFDSEHVFVIGSFQSVIKHFSNKTGMLFSDTDYAFMLKKQREYVICLLALEGVAYSILETLKNSLDMMWNLEQVKEEMVSDQNIWERADRMKGSERLVVDKLYPLVFSISFILENTLVTKSVRVPTPHVVQCSFDPLVCTHKWQQKRIRLILVPKSNKAVEAINQNYSELSSMFPHTTHQLFKKRYSELKEGQALVFDKKNRQFYLLDL